jgi:geranylgeranylglycerol-phosphate geranylgeranyltransferase
MIPFRDKAFAHLETWRPFISLNAGLTALAGAAVQGGGLPSPGRAAVIYAVPVVGYLGALYGTDFADRSADGETRPHRPIPSGRISEDESIIWMLLFVGAGFLGASWLGFGAVAMTCAAMGVGVIRAKTKHIGLVAPTFRSLGTAANVLFGVLAVGGAPTAASWVVAAVFFADTMPKSMVGGLWDVEADRATGVRTVWVRYGVAKAMTLVYCALAVFMALTAAVPVLVSLPGSSGHWQAGWYFAWYAVLTGMVGLAIVRLRQYRSDPRVALAALNWLLRDRSVLVGAFVAGAAGLAASLVLVAPVIVASEWGRLVLMAPRMYRTDSLATPVPEA